MISTFSKFYYNLEVTPENKYLDFDEGAGELTAIKDWFSDTDIVVTKNGRFISDFLLDGIAQTENP